MSRQKTLQKLLALHINGINQDKGFTLIELMVTIVIIAVLSAIALPSLLGNVNRAKQSEPKVTLAALRNAQQVHFLEKGQFVTNTSSVGELGIGIETDTPNYGYSLAATNYGVAMIAQPKTNSLKGYIAAIGTGYLSGAKDIATLSVMCESIDVGASANLTTSNVTFVAGQPVEGGGSISCNGETIEVH